MEFNRLIEERRSIRAYSGGICHEDLVSILTKAQQAPSWANTQGYKCYVAESEEAITAIREKALPGFNGDRTANAAYIVTTYLRDTVSFRDGQPMNEIGNGWAAYDLGLHDSYLLLAAKDAGYDTLIMGIRDSAALREILSIPDTEEVMAVIAIGKAAQEPVARPRKALEEVTKFF